MRSELKEDLSYVTLQFGLTLMLIGLVGVIMVSIYIINIVPPTTMSNSFSWSLFKWPGMLMGLGFAMIVLSEIDRTARDWWSRMRFRSWAARSRMSKSDASRAGRLQTSGVGAATCRPAQQSVSKHIAHRGTIRSLFSLLKGIFSVIFSKLWTVQFHGQG